MFQVVPRNQYRAYSFVLNCYIDLEGHLGMIKVGISVLSFSFFSTYPIGYGSLVSPSEELFSILPEKFSFTYEPNLGNSDPLVLR